jgi:BlaI family transcriptional regulator, penicillinase repressor
MPKHVHLGDLQLAIMRELWERREATASEVHAALAESRGLAPTTIATMLKKMEAKGVVTHRTEGRRYVYAPTVREDEVTHSMVSSLTHRLFGGDVRALVSHLVSSHDIDRDELEEIRRIIDEADDRRQGEPPPEGDRR